MLVLPLLQLHSVYFPGINSRFPRIFYLFAVQVIPLLRKPFDKSPKPKQYVQISQVEFVIKAQILLSECTY